MKINKSLLITCNEVVRDDITTIYLLDYKEGSFALFYTCYSFYETIISKVVEKVDGMFLIVSKNYIKNYSLEILSTCLDKKNIINMDDIQQSNMTTGSKCSKFYMQGSNIYNNFQQSVTVEYFIDILGRLLLILMFLLYIRFIFSIVALLFSH